MKRTHIALALLALFAGTENRVLAGPSGTFTATPTFSASPTASPSPTPQGPLDLGEACGFAVLAGSAFTNTGATTVSGDLGAQSETGMATVTMDGTNEQYSVLTTGALNSLNTAYNNAVGLSANGVTLGNDLSTDTTTGVPGFVGPGVYNILGSGGATTDATPLTLDGGNNPNAVFIFLIVGGLTTHSDFVVTLTGQAQAQNVFWVVEGPAGTTLGATNSFEGTILSEYAITLGAGANTLGGLLSNGGTTNGAITIDGGSDITDETCPEAAPTLTFTSTASPTITADVTPTHTSSASPSPSMTADVTSTRTSSASPSPTITPDESPTDSATASPSSTNTSVESPTSTYTDSPLESATPTYTESAVESATPTPSVSQTPFSTLIPMGSAAEFSILAGTEITNTGASATNGYIGVYPGSSVTGSGTLVGACTDYTGNDTVMLAAMNDLTTAYNAAQGMTPTDIIGATNIGGFTLPAGVYESPSSIMLNGPLTLDGGGNANATFVFQAVSSLTVANGSQVILENGAQARNVFWAVGSSAAIGTGVDFVGTLMAYTSISVGTGGSVTGSLLAIHGAVTLQTDAITTSLPSPCGDGPGLPVPTGSPAPQAAQHSYFYPSPSRGNSGNIAYNMAERGEVHIKIYNQAANLVDSIDDDEGSGWQSSSVSVQKFAPGVYYYIIEMDYASGATHHDAPRGFVVLH